MTDDEFISHLDRLGGEIDLWPTQLREDALMTLTKSVQAQAALKAIREVERLLELTAHSHHDDSATITFRATRQIQSSRPVLSPALRKASFAALGALALAAGIIVGMTPPSGASIVGSVQSAINGGGSDVW